jgi:hypothetical protein
MTDEDLKILAEEIVDFCNGLEALAVKLRTQIEKLFGEAKRKWDWNPDAIRWEKAQGAKGEFEHSEDVNNPAFKALLKDLAEHNGKLTREGWFYWTFKNGSTVGRKHKEAKR